jgi:hypothetical protein
MSTSPQVPSQQLPASGFGDKYLRWLARNLMERLDGRADRVARHFRERVSLWTGAGPKLADRSIAPTGMSFAPPVWPT